MNLIIDIGNSLAKLAVFQKGELLQKNTVEKKELEKKVLHFLEKSPQIDRAILSSVAEELPEWQQKFGERLAQVLILDPETPLPFTNRYESKQSLGNDRKALVAAAAKHFPDRPVLVIDAGTCITYDFKNGQNEYLGGGISPGLNMRYRALHHFTARLPLLDPEPEVELLGNSTENSMHSGIINGISMEIEGTVKQYQQRHKDLKIILTGGDAQLLSLQLKNSIFATSNFLLEGLNHILEFNNIS